MVPIKRKIKKEFVLPGDIALTEIYVITDNRNRIKPIRWLGNSKQTIKEFPDVEKRIAGKQLLRVQKNLMPNDWKPMGTIGPGVVEIRIRAAGEYRVIYVSKFSDAIYVLSAFQKKTQKTPRSEILRAKNEYKKIKHLKVEK